MLRLVLLYTEEWWEDCLCSAPVREHIVFVLSVRIEGAVVTGHCACQDVSDVYLVSHIFVYFSCAGSFTSMASTIFGS